MEIGDGEVGASGFSSANWTSVSKGKIHEFQVGIESREVRLERLTTKMALISSRTYSVWEEIKNRGEKGYKQTDLDK